MKIQEYKQEISLKYLNILDNLADIIENHIAEGEYHESQTVIAQAAVVADIATMLDEQIDLT